MLAQPEWPTGHAATIVAMARGRFVGSLDDMLTANDSAVTRNNPSVVSASHRPPPRWPSGSAALALISPSEKLVCRSFTLGRRNRVSIVQRA